MCLVISLVLLVAAYNFYEKGLALQAAFSGALAFMMLSYFIYRIIKRP
jgi:hypothetical protein